MQYIQIQKDFNAKTYEKLFYTYPIRLGSHRDSCARLSPHPHIHLPQLVPPQPCTGRRGGGPAGGLPAPSLNPQSLWLQGGCHGTQSYEGSGKLHVTSNSRSRGDTDVSWPWGTGANSLRKGSSKSFLPDVLGHRRGGEEQSGHKWGQQPRGPLIRAQRAECARHPPRGPQMWSQVRDSQ